MLFKTSPGAKITVFFGSLILLSSLVVFLIERKLNQEYVSFFDSLWWTIVTISTVGYGDRVPVSMAGRVVAMATIFVGMAIMGTVTGRIASFLMERQMKEEKGMLDFSNLKGHFVICGWKREMNRVLYEILEGNPELSPLELVMLNNASRDEIASLRTDSRLKGVKYVHGDHVEERELIRAGVKGAARIMVIADYLTEGEIQQIDSKTVMSVMSVKNLNRTAYVCAELLDTKFEKYLKISHCDEILLSRDFSRAMLAYASSGKGLSHVVNALVAGGGTGGIATMAFPRTYVGKTYRDLEGFFSTEHNAKLIGVLENTGNIMDRKREALRQAQMNPDISKLIPDLKSVKTLAANDPIINPSPDYVIPGYARGIVLVSPSRAGGEGQPA